MLNFAKEKMLVNIKGLIDEAKCYQIIREQRWSDGVRCAWCNSSDIKKNGHVKKHPELQKYHCCNCDRFFNDLTNTIFVGHHQPLSVWILCLYFMGLNLSNRQIAQELDLNVSDVQKMTTQLREGIVQNKPDVVLNGEVEFDEVYIVAGHKGYPEAVKKTDGKEDGIV